ncbi:hypothetical protein [Francisella uliginis]|uniref:Nicotinamide riboside transporter PnuC n=1 Tax=Francisella uliginis TaxID=573570 RepID=A0A1L4BU98_9GAMM|nr:hypothetical protein [Francisella uliginis]API87407.1 hypothetical protein F7310_08550 [Francisella uliginis]
MITLDYVLYDFISNILLFCFAFFAFKQIRFAWILVLCSLAIKVFIYGKYGLSSSLIYLSAQIIVSVLAGLVWFKNPEYEAASYNKQIVGLAISIVFVVAWVILMYTYINPAIINYEVLFSFDYLCYMLFVIGSVLIAFRMSGGLLFIAVEFISYAVSYANSAMAIKSAPAHIQEFIPYYWASAVCLFVAGILLVTSYTNVKRNRYL